MSDDATPSSQRQLGGLSLTFLTPAQGEGAAQTRPDATTPAETGAAEEARLVIVGSGPAGLTAAIYAARANLAPIVIGGVSGGGQLMITSEVENYPGFPDGIGGPELMGLFRKQAERFGARIVDADVARVDLGTRPFRLWAAGIEYRAQAVIVATGAEPIWLGIDSETRLRGRGISACATCDGFFFKGKEIAVVGGGDSALEEALYLTHFATKVHLIHRRDAFRGSKIMQDRVATHPKIELHLNRTIEEVLGDQHVESLRLARTDAPGQETLPVEGLFVAIGHRPNAAVFRDWLETDEKGYLRTEGLTTASSIEGVFIAGDVDDHLYRQAVTAAGEGCRAAIDAERWLEAQEAAGSQPARAAAVITK
ncbi:MAG: thioredoxin-disulfide reductase [Candidatus Limnocylindrales bacterium]